MVETTLNQAWELEQALRAYLLDAEGDLAEALETYVADQLRTQAYPLSQRNLLVDIFAIAARVNNRTPLEWFLEDQTSLSAGDRQLISQWHQGFAGLFVVTQVLPEGFEGMNWLTAKPYTVRSSQALSPQEVERIQIGEIISSHIVPISDADWMLYGPYTFMGKLGKPKLAVAIGNFKQHHRDHLYGDAPDLLEQAWQSVEQYHQDFLEFFESDEVTLPGYQLSQKLTQFQEKVAQRRLAETGIDSSKSLSEMAQEAGVEQVELEAAAAEAGVDAQDASKILNNKITSKMVMPKVELPESLKKAEQVTILSDPRWGQMFLPTYDRLKNVVATADPEALQESHTFIRQSLADPTLNRFVWQRLAHQYPTQLEKSLQIALECPNFKLARDFEPLLKEFNKPAEPELPEIASVPLHLDKLFQEALAEVSKPKSKGKSKKKALGFQK